MTRWKKYRGAFWTLIGACGLLGCSSAEHGEEASPDTGVLEDNGMSLQAESEVLNDVRVGKERIRFVRFSRDGSSAILLHAVSPIDVAEPVLQRLYAEQDDVTLLETFYALVPSGGDEPHPALLEEHAETALTQRNDLAVRRFDFDLNPLVARAWSPAQCDGYMLSASNPNNGDFFNSSRARSRNAINAGRICPSDFNGGPEGSCNADFQDRQVVAICNDGPGTMQAQMHFRHFDDEVSVGGRTLIFFNHGLIEDIPENVAHSWVFPASNKSHNLMFHSVPGDLNTLPPLSQRFSMRSGAWGLRLPLNPQ